MAIQHVYDERSYIDEMREALELRQAEFCTIINPPPDNVAKFQARSLRASD